MFKIIKNNEKRMKKSCKHRNKMIGTIQIPRVVVHKTLSNIYAQLVDDEKGVILCMASTKDKCIQNDIKDNTKVDASFKVGQLLAQKAHKKNIKNVVFDRCGYLYTGRVASLFNGIRSTKLLNNNNGE